MWSDGLNDEQLAVADHGTAPLVVLAGAGTGKTRALTARVSALIERGVPAERILLLTFTRRAADDMLARAASLVGADRGRRRPWGGTFHAVAHRLVSGHREVFDLPSVTVLDPADASAVVDLLREDHQLTGTGQRMPRSATLVDAMSRAVNTGQPLRSVLERHYPWCVPHADNVAALARSFVARKRERGLLDFDDLLLAWRSLLRDPMLGASVRQMWDYVLVDEYQDVNQLQVDIVQGLCPDGRGLTLVGDDAQAIYGFRGSDPGHLHGARRAWPDAQLVKLHRNYRSRQRILAAANLARPTADGHDLELLAVRGDGVLPRVISCYDVAHEARAVVDDVLAAVEEGTPLRDQAVLMRAASHSDLLELELTARRVPFRKYGGLKFLEAAHVKDFVATLRIIVNARDDVSWFRVLSLHKGVGRSTAGKMAQTLGEQPLARDDLHAEAVALAPARARVSLQATLRGLHAAVARPSCAQQADAAARVLRPLIRERYDDADARLTDIDRLLAAAAQARDLASFAANLTLDPPASTSDLAVAPHLDEDYLVLSTVHSAKGLEWSRVHLIGLVDGAFPSDMALGEPAGVQEEQRLFYVAITRARDELTMFVPLRMPHRRLAFDDRHSYAVASRFLDAVYPACAREELTRAEPVSSAVPAAGRLQLPQLEELWR